MGRALVMTHPLGRTLEQALQEGLRSNGEGVRALMDGLLRVLVQLHALSPPVFHRNLHPGSMFWDQPAQVSVWDFARATDTADDTTADLVLARPGYFPSLERVQNPVEAELYSVGAIAIHVLSRTPPDRIPVKGGVPQYRPLVRVDDALAEFIDRLLSAGGRRAFHSAAEALEALRAIQGRSVMGGAPVLALFGLLMLGGAGGVVFLRSQPAVEQPPHVLHKINVVTPEPPPDPPPPPQTSVPAELQLRVTTQPTGAELFIDGLHIGKAPLVTAVFAEKSVTVEARKPGYMSQSSTVVMRERQVLNLVLAPVPVKAPPPPPEPEPQPIVVKSDDRLQRELRRLVEAREEELTACHTENVDRVRFRVELDPKGALQRVEPVGGSQWKTTACAMAVVKRISSTSLKGGGMLAADVWIYFRPSFKVAVY